MALNTQPCCYVKTVTTMDCSVVHGLKQKPRRFSQHAENISCTARETGRKMCKAKCLPVTIWVNGRHRALKGAVPVRYAAQWLNRSFSLSPSFFLTRSPAFC